MCAAIRILIADDHPIVRCGLRGLIASESDMELVGEATNGIEAVLQARSHTPSVIVLDLDLPRLDGIGALRQIIHEQPKAHVLLLSGLPADDQLIVALQAGALGYLRKEASPTQIIDAIRDVHYGRSPLDPTVATQLLHKFNRPTMRFASPQALTKSEVAVLQYVAQGLSNQEIAVTLTMSERTVGNHISNILSKLHLNNRTQVALYALRHGLATLEQQRYEAM